MRTFILRRDVDETGISGTGIVAEGIEFTDGRVAMRWITSPASTAIYDDINAVEVIHGHGGQTRVEWLTYVFSGLDLVDVLERARAKNCNLQMM